MAIVFEKTKVKGGFPIFWRGEFAVLPGDFKLKEPYPEGQRFPKVRRSSSTSTTWMFHMQECTCSVGRHNHCSHVKKGSMLQVGDAVKVGESKFDRKKALIPKMQITM